MNVTKKTFALVVLFSTILSLSACSGGDKKPDAKPPVNPPKPPVEEEVEEVELGAMFSLVSENKIVEVGQEFEVDVKIKTEDQDIASTALYLKYDDHFEITEVKPSELFDIWIKNDVLAAQQMIELVAGKFPPGFSGEETFATISLKAKSVGKAEITVNPDKTEVINSEYKNIFNPKESTGLTIKITKEESDTELSADTSADFEESKEDAEGTEKIIEE